MTTKAIRVIKCFCGCSDLTEEEVKIFCNLSAGATLINEKSAKMLRRYFELQQKGDKSTALQMLDVYEKCDEYLKSSHLITNSQLEELCELGLPFELEDDLQTKIQTGEMSNIIPCLLRIQGECRNIIETSDEYAKYKHDLDKKRKMYLHY